MTIRVQDWPVFLIQPRQCLVEYGLDQLEGRPPCRLESDDLAVMEVHDRREEEFVASDAELGDVSHPLLMHVLGAKPALDQIRSRAPGLTFIGTVLLRPDQRLQSHLDHQSLDGLVIDHLSELTDRSRYPTIAIAPLVSVEDRPDARLQCSMPVARRQQFLPVMEGAACQTRELQQACERMKWP